MRQIRREIDGTQTGDNQVIKIYQEKFKVQIIESNVSLLLLFTFLNASEKKNKTLLQ
jgi:hypothetical protein